MEQVRNTDHTKPTRPAASVGELGTNAVVANGATTFDVPDYDMFASSFSYGNVQNGRIPGQAGVLCDDADFMYGSCSSAAGSL